MTERNRIKTVMTLAAAAMAILVFPAGCVGRSFGNFRLGGLNGYYSCIKHV